MGLFNRNKTEETKDTKEKKPVASTPKKTATKKPVKADVKKETKATKVVTDKKKSMNAYKILLKPLVTEKAANMSADSKYIFEVAVNTNKIEVAKAVEAVYGEKPVSVNIMNYGGKKVTRGRYVGRRKDWRKAIVTLAKGKTINIYEGL